MSEKEIPYKIYLSENEIPKAWYNVRADMKNKPAPLLHPGTHKPLTLDELTPIFCTELAKRNRVRNGSLRYGSPLRRLRKWRNRDFPSCPEIPR